MLAGPEWKKKAAPPGVEGRLKSLYLKKSVYFEKIGARMEWIYSPAITDRVFSDYAYLKPWYDLLRGCVPDLSYKEKE